METFQPVIPGFDPVRALGRGGSATVWLAVERGTGHRRAVKCLTRTLDKTDTAEAEESLLREVGILTRLDHEHLVKVHGILRLEGSSEAGFGVVMDYAAGGSLGQLVASRSRLSVGETVTILTPLAQALAYLHGQGTTHSDVSPGNVLFTAQGKPLLADLGISRMVGDAVTVPDTGTPGFEDPAPVPGRGAGLQPERDTYALAAIAWYCLTGSAPDTAARRPPLTLVVPEVPAALAAAIEAGLHPDRTQRPPVAEFGTAVFRSAAPAAVDLSGAVDASVVPELATRRRTQRRSKHRRPWAVFSRFRARPGRAELPGRAVPFGRRRRVAFAALALAALAVAGAVGTAWWARDGAQQAGKPQGTESRLSGAQPSDAALIEPAPAPELGGIRSPQPVEALLALSSLRDTALGTGRLELLDEVNAKDSPSAAADDKVRDELRTSGLVLAGFATYLSGMKVDDGATAERATVAVTVETAAYEERNSSGATVRTHAAAAAQRLKLVLVRVDGAWRISEILPGA